MRPIRLLKKPNRWSCAVTAWAMALDVTVAELVEAIGHDGSEVVWYDLSEPRCRRGFHSQELVNQAILLDRTATPIEAMPQIACPEVSPNDWQPVNAFLPAYATDRFFEILAFGRGVVEGASGRNNHAMAFENGVIFDPDGKEYAALPEAFQARNFSPYRAWSIR
jgi:hypothetical protein